MPYVGPATGQVIPRRSRRDRPSSSSSSTAPTSAPNAPHTTSPKHPAQPLSAASGVGVDNPDMLTPRPIDLQTNIDTLASNLAAASMVDQPGSFQPRRGVEGQRGDRDDHRAEDQSVLPKNESGGNLTASESSASLTSLSTQSEIGTPPTTSTTPDLIADVEARGLGEAAVDGVEVRVMRYREGLYAYTRNLYLEAKLSQTKKAGGVAVAPVNQFGLKQSGMERLAAKKALARRLNA